MNSEDEIRRTALIRNLLPSKLSNVIVEITACSNYHFNIVSLEARPAPKVLRNENIVLAYNLGSLNPKQEVRVSFRLALSRRRRFGSPEADAIGEKLRRKARLLASSIATRRIEKAATRLWRKAGNDIATFAGSIASFLLRNIRLSRGELFETRGEVFLKKFGGSGDFALAFRVIAGVVGIPTRNVYGFVRLDDGTVAEHIWCQIGDGTNWVDVDPSAGRVGLNGLPCNYFPIAVYEGTGLPKLFGLKYKIVRKMFKAALDVEFVSTKVRFCTS